MTSARISTGTTLVYQKGWGGAKWPTERHTAKVNGETLFRKDGHPRTFETAKAARVAAQKFIEDQQQ
jgi:hypothetical protein